MTGQLHDQPPRPVRPGAVVTGFILGTVGWLVIQFLPLITLGDDYDTYRIIDLGSIVIAISVAVGLLAYPGTRQAGAGLVLGAAASVIIWAGLCLTMVQL